jgi:rare lipoprotein A
VSRRERTHRKIYVLAIGMLAFAPAPLSSQPIADADAGFEERFLMDERSAPTFMRPEVIELLASLPPFASSGQDVAAAPHEPDWSADSSPIAMAEPKGPAKVLKDLLNTPVQELIVSRAEAGPEVPPPGTGRAESGLPVATEEPASVPVRAADPVAERPPADRVASAPAPIAVPAPEPRPEQLAVSPSDAPARPRPEPAPVVAAAEPPRGEPSTATSSEGTRNTDAAQDRRIAAGRAAWYQHSGRTASDEKFDPNRLTAAHHTLPFGTQVRVVNEANGRSVVVRINDRIPRKATILIDLSRASGKAVGLEGVGRVSLYRLEPVTKTAEAEAPAVQANAERAIVRAPAVHKRAVQRQVVQKRVVQKQAMPKPVLSAARQQARQAAPVIKQAKAVAEPRLRIAARTTPASKPALPSTPRRQRLPVVQESSPEDTEIEPPIVTRY